MKINTVIGARPQFVKAAMVSRAMNDDLQEEILHTGQHFDENMSRVFFDELGIPEPAVNLQISGGSHATMTGAMLVALESQFIQRKPDAVLIYGDTNSTVAAALAAAKLHIPVAHVEAGLRSFNRRMPEEINRIVADQISSQLYCPTHLAIKNLANEGITDGVFHVGDVMYDAALVFAELARSKSDVCKRLQLEHKSFGLVTLHRQENTDDPKRLRDILTTLRGIASDTPLVFPLHPRTRQALEQMDAINLLEPFAVTDPLPFLDMVQLEQQAKVIFTDSGGVQKEAYFHRVPCITLRDETEWVETEEAGWNQVVGANPESILSAYQRIQPGSLISEYGDGHASEKIIERLIRISSD